MIHLTKLAVFAVLMIAPSIASSQSWNAEQNSAWAFVQSAWDRHADAGTWYQSMDPGFFGWTTGYPVPTGRETFKRRADVFGAEGKLLFHRLDPLAITVTNDTAIAYYFAEIVEQDHKGLRKTSVQRCSNTLVRKRGEWNIFGWMCDTKSEG